MALPTKEGHLYKYKNRLQGWNYRYFKLTRSYIHYYEAQYAPSPRRSIVRSDIISVGPCTAFPDKEHCFELVTKSGEKWYMVSSSESEMRQWITALASHLPPPLAAAADSSKSEKEKEAEDTGPPSPRTSVPSIPNYISDVMTDPPPSYEECVPQNETQKQS